jgi:hypothetical protein
MYVGVYRHVVHTGGDAYACPGRCHAHRWVHVYSIAIRSAKYIMCMDIRLYLDACTSERHRGARVGVRLRRVRARCARVGLHLPQGEVAAPNAPECLSRACACMATFCGFGPFGSTSAHWCAAGAGRHARALRGRRIGATKVEALPEWLGQCTLLEDLCVPRPPPPPPCAFAAVPALRCRACAVVFAFSVQSPLRMHRCVYHAHARVCVHAW